MREKVLPPLQYPSKKDGLVDDLVRRLEGDFLKGDEPLDVTEFVRHVLRALRFEYGNDVKERDKVFSVLQSELLHPGMYNHGRCKLIIEYGYDDVICVLRHPDGSVEHTTLNREELLRYLNRLRKRIQEEFYRQGEEHVHVRKALLGGNVTELHSPFVRKRMHAREDEMEALRTAMDRLYALKERSSYLAYPGLRDGGEHWFIDRKAFTTLDAYCQRRPSVTFVDVLGIVRDAIRGASFLVRNGLRLTDLDITNIGVDDVKKTGFLFDYDGLRVADVQTDYYAKGGYIPPERRNSRAPIQPSSMIYELGSSLRGVLEVVKESVSKEHYRVVANLANRMNDQNPDARPSFEEVLVTLDNIISLEEKRLSSEGDRG